MGTRRPHATADRDTLNRTIKVSGNVIDARATAPAPVTDSGERACGQCGEMTKRTSGLCRRCDPTSKRNRNHPDGQPPAKTATAEQLEAAVASLVTGDDWQRWLDVQRRFHSYSWRNTILIAWQRPGASRVAGRTKWAELGRQLNPDARPITILAPVTKKYTDTDQDGVEVERQRMFFRDVQVYDIADTDGEPLPTILNPLQGDAPTGMLDALHRHADTAGVPVAFTSAADDSLLARGANGYAARDNDGNVRIVVSADLSPAQQAKTFAHELGHVMLGHLDSNASTAGHLDRADQELEAESFAYMVTSSWGVDSGDYSFGYVAAWSGGNPKKVHEVAKRVSEKVKPFLRP